MQVTSMPMPARKALFGGKAGTRTSKYDLSALRAGTEDCIVLDDIDARKAQSKLSSAVSNYRRSGKPGKFTIRTFEVVEDGVTKTKVGVWRLADNAAGDAGDAA